MSVPTRRILEPVLGPATLLSGGNGKALWDNGWHYAGGSRASSGYAARLIGGAQSSWDDFALIKVHVTSMLLRDLKGANWQYWMENTEQMGVNLVIHIHNPDDLDQEAEISQQADIATLDKAAGNNSHELVLTTDQFYYYGYSTGSGLTEGAPNYYGMDDFQEDPLFYNWVIDSISLAYGWHSGDLVFDDAMVYKWNVNGTDIPLRPSVRQLAMSKHYIDNDIPISSGIYTPRRIHVQPVFANYATTTDQQGIGHLARGGYGLTAGNGGNIDLGIGYVAHMEAVNAGTDVVSFGIPVNIPVNKIDSLSYIEKTQDDTDKQPIMSFRLDASRRGAWAHEAGTSTTSMYLVDYRPAGAASDNDWQIVTPLTDTTWQLKNWHTRIATPDAGIAADADDSTFAAYKATDIGNYYIKQIVFAYTGDTAGDWAKIGGLCINGIEYIFDLNPNDAVRHFYIKDSNAISSTFFPQTPFRLHSLSLHASAALAGTNLTITKDAGMDSFFDGVDYSYDIATAAVTSFLKTWTEKLCYAADDKLVIAQSNTGSKDVGIDLCWEVL